MTATELKKYKENPYILVVDDMLKNLQIIGNILESEDFEVSVSDNANDALQMINEEAPDLILLDVMMPVMNGFELCKLLKSKDDTKDIPIIFLTAKNENEDIVTGFKMGGVDYITKPFNKEELLVRIKTHLELKYAKDQLERKNERLSILNKEKNELMGITAHDLKNPLGSIMGFAEVILNEEFELNINEIREYTKDIYRASKQMYRLILDLLDINAIEEGKIQITPENIDIYHSIERIVKVHSVNASKKKIQIIFEKEFEDMYVFADKDRILQVLDNLVSNAIKFSPEDKKVIVKAYYKDTKPRFEIIDQGPGLEKEDKEKLFQKFAKLSASPTGGESSTGLGLSIVKKLVEGMNGTIWAESEPGKGASFIFTLEPGSKSTKKL